MHDCPHHWKFALCNKTLHRTAASLGVRMCVGDSCVSVHRRLSVSFSLDPFDIGVSFEHQARHMDWLVVRHVERFERICSFLVRCAEVDADDFPDAEAAGSWVVFHAESISDRVSFDFHNGLTSQWSEPPFAPVVLSLP